MQLIKALFLCIFKHWKQKDKSGKRYIWHPIYVMLKVKGYKEKIVALLHDIVEDTDVSFQDLKKMKFSSDVLKSVYVITKNKNQDYFEYLEKIKQNKIARAVKRQDLKHNSNLKRLKKITQEDYKRLEKYEQALEYLN